MRVDSLAACSYPSMGSVLMMDESGQIQGLLSRLASGDQQAVAELFARYRERLRRKVCMRLDRRLQGRIDPSDVLQEAYLDVTKRAADYAANPTMTLFLWMRFLTGQRLLAVHRQYFGTKMRDVGQEVSLYQGALPQASSSSLAAHLLGRLTSPSLAAQLAEMQIRGSKAARSVDRGTLRPGIELRNHLLRGADSVNPGGRQHHGRRSMRAISGPRAVDDPAR
jgi:RNA polymerase sigma-70 factor, ECF subfamily